MYVAAFTIAEIERGLRRAEQRDSAQGLILRRWFETGVLPGFAGRPESHSRLCLLRWCGRVDEQGVRLAHHDSVDGSKGEAFVEAHEFRSAAERQGALIAVGVTRQRFK
jgi:hypothetical protein